ncbi:MAG: metallophosphatase [Bacteroidia bacterium]|nr:metallophosphatase [Bacteroidia bacterium]
MKRRSFVKTITQTGVLLSTGSWTSELFRRRESVKITILHTNDVHSRIEPFPNDGSRKSGLGGTARRATLIEQVRAEEEHVLLLDAGDIFQGTPYFNFYGGELEFKLMSEMRYDAATIGNHDFDAGIEGLYNQLPNAEFPLLITNYDFKDTIMHSSTKPYEIFERGGVRIGVLGVGIELDGLVPSNLFGATQYLDPVKNVNKYAAILRHDEKCDYVICLSHLGYRYNNEDRPSDYILAEHSEDIDLIIGGHTHTFLDKPDMLKNRVGEPVIVNQVGWGGMYLGRIDVYFERSKRKKCASCENLAIS